MGIYEQYGVRAVINATCHWTAYGGSVMWPEVVQVMSDARKHCVDMQQLLDRASEVLCRYTHAQAGHIVSGCAAGLQVGAAAMMTGDDPTKMEALPHTQGVMNSEFIARRFERRRAADGREYIHWGYAQAVRGAGGVFVEVGDSTGVGRDQLEQAFGERTAGVYWVSDGVEPGLQLADVIAIAHSHDVPVLVDASNTLPPAEHLHSFIDLAADLVAFSGGKGLRGPQGSGILVGRADLIRAGRMQSAPLHGIGRPMKVSKEEIVGLLTALETWVNRDHAADLGDAKRRTHKVVEALGSVPGIRAEFRFPDHIGRPYPTVFVHLDPDAGLTGAAVINAMLERDPSVAIMHFSDPQIVRIDVRILSDDESELVSGALREVVSALIAIKS
jgi:L-seryl-tRNA(Ser) seleniumtransferase